jgi:hypothetical protein
VVKPFSGAEVIARMRAVLRRGAAGPEAPVGRRVGPLRVELGSRRVGSATSELALSRKEFDLLAELVARRRGRHARGPDRARVDENWFGSTKTLDVHVGWLRGKLGDDPRRRVPAHGARRRLPLHGGRRMGVLSLRARLLLALAYVLVLAIGSMLVPLVRSVRDRVSAEVKTQALAQADAAGGAGGLDGLRGPRLARSRAAATTRGRARDRGAPPTCARARRQRRRATPATSRRARRSRGAARQRVRRSSAQRDARQRILATAVPMCARRPDGAVRITQSVDAVRARCARRRVGLVLVGLIVLALGLGAGALLAASVVRPLRRLAAPRGARARATCRVRVPDGGLARAARGGPRVQRDDRAGAADGRRPARLRRRRLAPAADAADRAAPALGGGARRRVRSGARAGRRRAGEVDRLSAWSRSCWC